MNKSIFRMTARNNTIYVRFKNFKYLKTFEGISELEERILEKKLTIMCLNSKFSKR